MEGEREWAGAFASAAGVVAGSVVAGSLGAHPTNIRARAEINRRFFMSVRYPTIGEHNLVNGAAQLWDL